MNTALKEKKNESARERLLVKSLQMKIIIDSISLSFSFAFALFSFSSMLLMSTIFHFKMIARRYFPAFLSLVFRYQFHFVSHDCRRHAIKQIAIASVRKLSFDAVLDFKTRIRFHYNGVHEKRNIPMQRLLLLNGFS